MHNISKYLLVLVIIFGSIGCDQKTKSIAKRNLEFSIPVQYCHGLVRLHYAENEGGFLSIGSNLPPLFRRAMALLLSIVTVTGFIVLLFSLHKLTMVNLISFSLLIAGASGNLIDRLFNQGRVIDFIIVGTNRLHTAVFNIADVLLMAGTSMVVIVQLLQRRKTS
ncbi:MAG: signal peptidase II [Bacteroidota bacterium]|jgi:signal peptidase II